MKKEPRQEKSKSERNLFIGFIILLVLIFSPIPYIIQESSLAWSPSLFQRKWNLFYPVKPVEVETFPTNSLFETGEEMLESEPTPTIVPIPTYEPFEEWNTYTNGKFNYTIKYPKSADLDYKNKYSITGRETGIYLRGEEFLVGGSVTIRILANPINLSLAQIGSVTYSAGCNEVIQDLGWQEIQFLNQTVFINSSPPPLCGDSTLHNIYLINHKGKIFALEVSFADRDVNTTYFQDLANKILSTFRFLD